MRQVSGFMLTLMMLAAPVGVLLAAEADSGSPYDRNPQCLERQASKGTKNCVIDDGPPPRKIVRRVRQEVVNAPQTAANDGGSVTKRASPAVSHATE